MIDFISIVNNRYGYVVSDKCFEKTPKTDLYIEN